MPNSNPIELNMKCCYYSRLNCLAQWLLNIEHMAIYISDSFRKISVMKRYTRTFWPPKNHRLTPLFCPKLNSVFQINRLSEETNVFSNTCGGSVENALSHSSLTIVFCLICFSISVLCLFAHTLSVLFGNMYLCGKEKNKYENQIHCLYLWWRMNSLTRELL